MFVLSGVCAVSVVECASILGIDDGIPRTDDGSVMDVGVTDVASQPDVVDAGMDDVTDAAPFSPLSCGAVTCNFAVGEACCRTGASTYKCIDAGAKCADTLIPCDRKEQCAGGDAGPRDCCTTDVLTDAGTYVATAVACMPVAQCSPVPIHYDLCDDLDAADCPDGTTCTQSTTTLPTFYICR